MGIKLVTNRNITVSSTAGNSIKFEKGKPVHVPDQFIEDCMAAGAIPAEGEELVVKSAPEKTEAPTGTERKHLILDGIDAMVILNERGSFSANGFPKQPLLEKIIGFVIDTRELETLWRVYDVARRAGNEVEIPGTINDSKPVVESTDESEGVVAEGETSDEERTVEQEAEAEESLGAEATEGTEGTTQPDTSDKPAPTVSKKKTAKKKTAKKS